MLLDKQESSDQQRERLSQENTRLLRKLRDLERQKAIESHCHCIVMACIVKEHDMSDV